MVGLAAVGLLVLGVAACGSSGGSGSGPGSSSGGGASLDGTDWVLTAMTPTVPGLASVPVTAKFSGGRVSGHSGCNTYGTSFTQDGSKLTFGEDIVTTRIACPSGPSAVEQAYLERLPKVASFARSGSTLTLKDADGATVLTYRTAPGGEALTGDWTVTSLYTGTALASPVGAELTATFDTDGIHGNSGCNTFRGPVETDGRKITIGPLAATLMACADDALNTQEHQYTQALEAAKTFEVIGDRLSLFRADGGYAVEFVRS
jgi:heat shock protein HslJ